MAGEGVRDEATNTYLFLKIELCLISVNGETTNKNKTVYLFFRVFGWCLTVPEKCIKNFNKLDVLSSCMKY